MTVLITLSGVGSSAGPTFNLYASPDGITFTLFAPGINKTALEPGYTATVPDGTTDIKVTSLGQCTNSYVATVGVIPTTTTTTTANPYLCALNDVTIGSQIWTACNLNVETYADGTIIPEVQVEEDWRDLTTGAWCYYENNTANGPVYGKLYNWYAVNDPRGLAPAGYHIPTDAEWTTLTTYLDGESVAGGKMKETGFSHWNDPNTGATNSSGFTGLPGGYRYDAGVFDFIGIGVLGMWWSSTEDNIGSSSFFRYLSHTSGVAYRISYPQAYGYSVRLIKDEPVNSVEWSEEPYGVGGDPSGGFYYINGTVEIIGDPVTLRASVYIPDNAGPGYFASGFNIWLQGQDPNSGSDRYTEVERPRDALNVASSQSLTLPAGNYNFEVLNSWNGTGSGGSGGIVWTQA